MKSHYAVLGIAQTATSEEIRAAWRRLASQTHPDKVQGREDEYKDIARAYDALWHPISRGLYDIELRMLSKCQRCGGTGTVQKQKGFTQRVIVPCPECQK